MAPSTDPLEYPPPSAFLSESFTLIIGKSPATTTYTIHKDVAGFYSEFLEAAMKTGTFKEGQEKIIRLPEESMEYYSVFIGWMYTRKLEDLPDPKQFNKLLHLWTLADRALAPMFANAVMDLFPKKCLREKLFPGTWTLKFIYEATAEGHSMRKLIIALVINAFTKQLSDGTRKCANWPVDATWDLLQEALAFRPTETSGQHRVEGLDVCGSYHTHLPGERCP